MFETSTQTNSRQALFKILYSELNYLCLIVFDNVYGYDLKIIFIIQ